MNSLNTIDEYIKTFPKHIQAILDKIRHTIKEVAPQATETISYGIPTFKLNGNLVHFAAYKKYIGFYPSSSAVEEFREELFKYEMSKGTIKFPLEEPIPFDLIKKIVEFRVKENLRLK